MNLKSTSESIWLNSVWSRHRRCASDVFNATTAFSFVYFSTPFNWRKMYFLGQEMLYKKILGEEYTYLVYNSLYVMYCKVSILESLFYMYFYYSIREREILLFSL